jgi:hypothetical protein
MKWLAIIIGAISELVALFVIARVWRDLDRGWVSKVFWSVVLLVPVFGFLYYGFVTMNPQSQGDHTEDSMGASSGPTH